MEKNTLSAKKPFRINPYMIICIIILSVYCIALIGLVAWGFMKSFHEVSDYQLNGWRAYTWPGKFTLENYALAFEEVFAGTPKSSIMKGRKVYLLEMIGYSIFYSIGCAVVSTMTSCIMAYMTTKHKFKFNKVIDFVYFFSLMVPILGSMASSIRITTVLGLRNTWIGMFIMKMTFTGGNGYLLFKAAFASLDDGYKEAAVIDGAGNLQVLVQIMLPLIKNMIFTFILLGFVGYWNDYTTPMIYLEPYPVASYGVWNYTQNNASTGTLLHTLAAYMILIIPTFVLFMIFRNKFMRNVTEGGMKG